MENTPTATFIFSCGSGMGETTNYADALTFALTNPGNVVWIAATTHEVLCDYLNRFNAHDIPAGGSLVGSLR